MRIGEIIKANRVRRGFTQEDLANKVGVSTSAVSKWENGMTVPDLMMIAPLARVFYISTDELLMYEKELDTKEVEKHIREVEQAFCEKQFETAFNTAKEKVLAYPNEKVLLLSVAYLTVVNLPEDAENKDAYEKEIVGWFKQVLTGDDYGLRIQGAEGLFYFYFNKQNYEEAEKYLEFFSDENPEKKRKQGMIYSKTGRTEQSYKAYEEVVFSSVQIINNALNSIAVLAMEEKDIQKAEKISALMSATAKIFEMGEYAQEASMLEYYIMTENKEQFIKTVEKMYQTAGTLGWFTKSSIYEHMTFKEDNGELEKSVKQGLLELVNSDDGLEFLKSDFDFQKLKEKMQRDTLV